MLSINSFARVNKIKGPSMQDRAAEPLGTRIEICFIFIDFCKREFSNPASYFFVSVGARRSNLMIKYVAINPLIGRLCTALKRRNDNIFVMENQREDIYLNFSGIEFINPPEIKIRAKLTDSG